MRERLRHGLFVSIAILAPLVAAPDARAAVVNFIIDDGTSDIAFGNFNMGMVAADTLVVNQFDAGPGGATINRIDYVFGTPGASGSGTAAVALQVVLLEDNNDNGSIDNATLLASVGDVPTNIDNDVFNSVVIPNTFVTGRFFVGLFAAGIPHGQAIVGADTNDPPGATFGFAGTALDLNNILATADVFSLDPTDTGIALIRAFGFAGEIPEPRAFALLALGFVALVLLGWRSGRAAT
jgi:hypothetical protein